MVRVIIGELLKNSKAERQTISIQDIEYLISWVCHSIMTLITNSSCNEEVPVIEIVDALSGAGHIGLGRSKVARSAAFGFC